MLVAFSNAQVTTFEALSDLKADVGMKLKVWRGLQSWEEVTNTWSNTPFDTIVAEDIEQQVQMFLKIALQGDRTLSGNSVVSKLKGLVSEFKATLPVVVYLRCPALKRRHWNQIHQTVGYEIKVRKRRCDGPVVLSPLPRPCVCAVDGDYECRCMAKLVMVALNAITLFTVSAARVQGVEGFTLGELVARHVMDHADAIAKIASEAVQEGLLEEGLQKVEAVWVDLELRILSYKDMRDTFILGPVEDISASLDESLVSVNMILGSRFVGPIREPVDGVYKRLLLLQVCYCVGVSHDACSYARMCLHVRLRCTSRHDCRAFASVRVLFCRVPVHTRVVDDAAAEVDCARAHLHRAGHHTAAAWRD